MVSWPSEFIDSDSRASNVTVLRRSAAVLSGCGIVMAGTFSSLFFMGTLDSMRQLGFALSFGVLLDTFILRPLLVPTFLILLYEGWPGAVENQLNAS